VAVYKRVSWQVTWREEDPDEVEERIRTRTFESRTKADDQAAELRSELPRSAKVTVKQSHRWQVRYRDVDGNQHSETFPTQQEAKDRLAAIQVARSRGELLAPHEANMTLGEWWPQWVAAREWKPSSRVTHDWHWRAWIEPTFGRKKLRSIKPNDVSQWHREMEAAGLALRSRGAIHRSLAMALRGAEKNGLLVRRPYLDAPKVTKTAEKPAIPNAEQATAIIGAWPARLRAFPTVIARAGLRPAECAGLTWDALDLDAGVIHVRRQLIDGGLADTKTPESVRDVGIDDELVAVLREHRKAMVAESLAAGRPLPELVFTSGWGGPKTRASGGPMTRRAIGEMWRRAVKDLDVGAGVRGPHALRHFHASALLTAGVPVHEVAKRLGHKNGTITMSVYAHVLSAPDADERARNAIRAAFGAV
jgi:integrase